MVKRLLGQAWRDRWLLLVITLVLILIGFLIIPQERFSLFGPLTSRIQTNEKVVALTFDDGPTEPQTSRLLGILQREHVTATFYLIGLEMERSPTSVDAIMAAGHEVGNHSYRHNGLLFMGYQGEAREIERTDDLIRQHGYVGPITIRPPYGYKLWELPLYAAAHDRQIIMWDFVLGNEPNSTVASILAKARDNIRPGSIIIMHPMYNHNKTVVDSVQPLIRQLKSHGYSFVTVSELLQYH